MTRYTLDVEGDTYTLDAFNLEHLYDRIFETFIPGVRVELLCAERVR